MKTEIITIGDEILIGQIVDTNSAWIGSALNNEGGYIHQITSLPDDSTAIHNALSDASKRSELVIVTGGLGPTKDDITKKVLCNYFNTHLIVNNDVLEDIKKIILQSGHTHINDANKKQAEVPENCKVLRNHWGTAPGLWFEQNGVIFVSLPGVPHEMKMLMRNQVFPLIKQRIDKKKIHYIHQTIHTTGIAEADLGMQLNDWQNLLPPSISVAYLPSPGVNKIRLTLKGNNLNQLHTAKQKAIEELTDVLGDAIFSTNAQKLEEVIGLLLLQNKATLSTAESCSGGNIARLITSIAGSSEYYEGSVVAYSNKIKNKVLNVQHNVLEQYGAVSKQVIIQMAEGVRKLFDTTYSLSTSGIAGPEGGTEDKPIGTIWIAVSSAHGTTAKCFQFSNIRKLNIKYATNAALNMLRLEIIKNNK